MAMQSEGEQRHMGYLVLLPACGFSSISSGFDRYTDFCSILYFHPL
jgi:hypothetical protein